MPNPRPRRTRFNDPLEKWEKILYVLVPPMALAYWWMHIISGKFFHRLLYASLGVVLYTIVYGFFVGGYKLMEFLAKAFS